MLEGNRVNSSCITRSTDDVAQFHKTLAMKMLHVDDRCSSSMIVGWSSRLARNLEASFRPSDSVVR